MSRRAARITHDEVTRVVKAVRDLGFNIGRVVYNGEAVEVVIDGDSVDNAPAPIPNADPSSPLLREPKL